MNATTADGGGEIAKGGGEFRREKKLQRRAHVGGRVRVEKERRVRRERIGRILLREETHDRQVVTQDANAAQRTLAAGGDFFSRGWLRADRGKQSQIHTCLERSGA